MMKFDKNAPRYSAGSIKLTQGTGAITEMCSVGEFLEVYKAAATFRIQMPESLDPAETNPNMMGTATLVARVGSINVIVARTFIQAYKLILNKQFPDSVDTNHIIRILHESKELLLNCERANNEMNERVAAEIDRLKRKSLKRETIILNQFPSTEGLAGYVASFLTNAKRFIQNHALIFNAFYSTAFDGPHFHKILNWLLSNKKENEGFLEFVRGEQERLRNLVEMRNGDEHPTESRKLLTDDFSLLPSNKVEPPSWKLVRKGEIEYQGYIHQDMNAIQDYLMLFSEGFVIHCVVDSLQGMMPYRIIEIPETIGRAFFFVTDPLLNFFTTSMQ